MNCLKIIIFMGIALQMGFIKNIYASKENSSISKENSIIVGKTLLPNQVPHLNKIESYIVGNGIICSSGTVNGQWDFIAGPDYTCPNLIGNEKLSIIIEGVEHQLTLEMFRARETGLFYGSTQINDLQITLLDYTVPKLSIVSRLIFVQNNSIRNYSVQLKAYLTPIVFTGISDTIIKSKNGTTSAALIQIDTTRFCMFGHDSKWVKNWENRHLLTSWSGGQSLTQKDSGVYRILSETKNMTGNSRESFNLCHYAHYPNKTEEEYLIDIESRNGVADAEQSILEWQKWFRNVPDKYRLEKITDPRTRDIVEGGLYVIKTNQTKDGGIVANEKRYDLSWTRDAYCGLRGLLATGHFDELKQFLLFMNNVYKAFKFIPNAVSCGSNTFALYNGSGEDNPNRYLGQFSPCPEANTAPETPALLILVARDYFKTTNDIKTLFEVNESLQYSMDIQLKHAIANNYKLEFSGDETELCGAVATSSAGFNRDLSKYWSMSSIALCCASLDFYIEYLALKKQNINSYFNSVNNKTLDLKIVLQKLNDAFENDFWRTDLPDNPSGLYDWCRIKSDNSFPKGRITNFSLFPVYYKMKPNFPNRFETNIKTIGSYFKESNNTLPLVSNGDNSYLGHDLGYLLWSLVQINDPQKTKIYDALVYGNSAQCWGSFNEAYDADGKPNNNNLRTFETGVNIDAIAKYWNLGNKWKIRSKLTPLHQSKMTPFARAN